MGRTLTQALTERVERGEFPGAVTLIASDGDARVETIGNLAFGASAPMRRDTIFRIASLTKPVMAAATMLLVEDGTLALDEPVDRLLPELAGRRVLRRLDGPLDDTVPAHRPITVEDLLTFRLGHGMITEPGFMPPYPIVRAAEELELVMAQPDPPTPHRPDEWITLFGRLPLMDQPGERWRYNTGTLVLSVLLARASGQPLEDLLLRRVFEPLGMTETGFTVPADQIHRMPQYYMTDFATGVLELQPYSTPAEWTAMPAFPSGSSGLASTVDDYLAFARMLLRGGGDLLSSASVELMTGNRLTKEQVATAGLVLGGRGWGYGMAATPDGRYGWEGGYGTAWFNDPARGTIAIVMTQVSDFLFNGTLQDFFELAAA